MAAGLSIEESDIDEFRRRLNENAKLTEDDFVPQIWIDVPMPFEYVNEKIVDELKGLEPFGQGNEKPLFAQKSLTIRNVRVLGKNRNVVKMNLVTNTGHPFDGLDEVARLGVDEFAGHGLRTCRLDDGGFGLNAKRNGTGKTMFLDAKRSFL